ncbi:MAG: hypothetical protein ACK5AZ_13705 [Bryobacteraceae bacterium]
MAKLKAGRVSNFENSLAAEIEAAMKAEWQAVKGTPLPGGPGEEDRKILFVAVARGLLKFLKDRRADIQTSANDGVNHRHIVEWDYE